MPDDTYGDDEKPSGLVGIDGKELGKANRGEISSARQAKIFKACLVEMGMEIERLKMLLEAVVTKAGGSVSMNAAEVNRAASATTAVSVNANRATGEILVEVVQVDEAGDVVPPAEPNETAH